jgi:nucleotide-binding universal stress UspA family protein
MKTILVPVHRDSMNSCLETALLLARRCDSYIEGFAFRTATAEFIATDIIGPFAIEAYEQESKKDAERARTTFETFMQTRNVPKAGSGTSGPSFGWLDDESRDVTIVGSHGRVFDVIALSRPDALTSGLYHRALESALFESGRPILLTPPTAPKQIATNILIAWNGSTEQTRAIAFGMPLLQRAEHVTVLAIPGGQGVPGPSGDQMTLYLKRNGISASLLTVELNGRSTGETVLAVASDRKCDLLIKGAYTQSRLRQLIFGGTTRHILSHAQLPVLMAH